MLYTSTSEEISKNGENRTTRTCALDVLFTRTLGFVVLLFTEHEEKDWVGNGLGEGHYKVLGEDQPPLRWMRTYGTTDIMCTTKFRWVKSFRNDNDIQIVLNILPFTLFQTGVL